ncbi:hypothetical protein F5884DRAFT_835828 [Xylogone sp. PMI_703]|nr:hypothetical protein F5884DRAFT_835828 [Xylogone sp. PMI_703]
MHLVLNLNVVIETVRSKIELVEIAFTGGIKLDRDNKTFYREKGTGTQYVGRPSPEIDQAWDNLLLGLNFDVSPGQVMHLQEETYKWPSDQQYFLGLDVFHSLHCLNRVRQALDVDYYQHELDMPGHPARHDYIAVAARHSNGATIDIEFIDHCIDHIRQALMCHADLTPMTWEQRADKLILKTSTVHTCRNFQKIWDYSVDPTIQINYDTKAELASGQLYVVD